MRRKDVWLARVATLLLFVVAIAAATGCSCDSTSGYESGSQEVVFVAVGEDYDDAGLEALMDETDLSDVSVITAEEAQEARNDALIDLRTQGDEASSIADLLTRDFPLETIAVPVYVESGSLSGTDAWIVVEAWGQEGGTLEHRRVWAFEKESGALLWSASRS